jgi:hypothetical protein
MHPKLSFALESGYLEPALMPDGNQLEINGTRYYVFKNSGEKLTQSRLYAFNDFLEEANRFVIRKEDLMTAMELIQQTLHEAMMTVTTEPKECMELITQAKYRASTTFQRLQMGASIERIWEISAIWFISEHEDPELNDPSINKQKVQDFMTRPELIGFFQSWAKNVWNALPAYLDNSLLNAIKEINLSEILQNEIFRRFTHGAYGRINNELSSSLNSQTEVWGNVNDTLDYLPTSSTN